MEQEEQQISIITLVEKQKRGKHRYNIFLNEEYAFSVHEDILIKHRLVKGESVDLQDIERIIQDEERNNAYMKALRAIGRRPHSSSELKRKLKESGYEPPIIEWVIEKLASQNYLNDEEFAKMWTDSRIISQKKGRNLVRQELQQKGIDKELVKHAMENINQEDEIAGAMKLAQTKWKQTSGEAFDKKRKTAAFLMRRGYTGAVVTKVLSQLSSEPSEDDFEIHDDTFDD
ncbi:RecX family transcriptional regulator [Paenibacillus sp. CGMCC 1.16610]|uniref:Regulatory protein RecX n=1 Tax=Paenibacillus anseongense TaxID=2682845 RepID=A0ABW9U9N5_9BACL|nr:MULTISPECIES: RecX family transcriptional regulator [Paenibacillus]MBA2937761.1 RecX family transcriptional regulator [Paenibacillus sp. CGMCC 1.16610]MVQ36819.1 RecX family transcriptional regulator [Paenibacillus anseongense]